MEKWILLVVCTLLLCFVRFSHQAMLNIHVVAHSHDDVGWLKTVDQYYYGANESIQTAGVQYTIDTVVEELLANPARKFIYVEMAYFFRWWREQDEDMQQIVQKLVANEQLNFINGGWTMHDEACVHFEDMVSQMTLGHQFLKNTFGVTPKAGWQIDPFGHSATSAYIDAAIGFDGVFFARMDYQDELYREAHKSLEMNWYPSMSRPDSEILTGMMYGGYSLGGFEFERGDTPVMNDPLLENYNMGEIADALVGKAMLMNSYLRHNNVMLPWGGDFQYMNAHINYKNIDKLIAYINGNSSFYNATIFYSTPALYALAIKNSGATLPNKTGDFMPYANNAYSYWTGYFTSRPTFKGMVRYSSNILSAVSAAMATAQVQSQSMYDSLYLVQQPNAVATHHDSVTGTEKQHVTYDYELNLAEGNAIAFQMMSQIVGGVANSANPPNFAYCPLLNQSICETTTSWNSGVLVVNVYNPLAWDREENVRLPVSNPKTQVVDKTGANVPAQISPGPNGQYNLTFTATVPALGYETYFLQVSGSPAELVPGVLVSGAFTLQNKYLSVQFDGLGNLQGVDNLETGQHIGIQQEYLYYIGSTGNQQSSQCSGAYIFRPATDATYSFPQNTYTTLYNGSVVSEFVRTLNPWVSQIVRLHANAQYLEIVDVIGPINITDNNGKEVITRYTTSLNNNETWYSDSNGIEMIKRMLNWRSDWPLNVTQPVAGNYVPVDAITFINDTSANLQFTILPDRSRSSASLSNGEIETMLHRRLLKDDSRGVGEPLNESTVLSSSELLVFTNATSAASVYRPLAKMHYHPFVVGFSQTSSVSQWVSQNQATWAPATALPVNVQLLSFVPLPSGEYILRLHHIFQQGEDPVLSLPVTVDMAAIFPSLNFFSVQETQLTAVQPPVPRPDAVHFLSSQDKKVSAINVLLQPAEIRTFIVKFSSSVSVGKMSIV